MEVPTEEQIRNASQTSFKSRQVIEKSKMAGCFHCCKIFPAAEIDEWWDEDRTPVCPRCGIDSVLGDATGYPINEQALEKIRDYAF